MMIRDKECGQGFQAEVLKDVSCPGYGDLELPGFENRLQSFRCNKL